MYIRLKVGFNCAWCMISFCKNTISLTFQHRIEDTKQGEKLATYNLLHLPTTDQVYNRNNTPVKLCVFGCQNVPIENLVQ